MPASAAKNKRYRIDNIRMTSANRQRVVRKFTHLQSQGFITDDVGMALRSRRRGEIEQLAGVFYTNPSTKAYRMHAVVHALHIRLHARGKIPMVRNSVLFRFTHTFFELFENRKLYESCKRKGLMNDSFREARENAGNYLPLDLSPETTTLAPVIEPLMEACAATFPNRKKLGEAVEKMFLDPRMHPPLIRLSKETMAKHSSEPWHVRKELVEVVDYLRREARLLRPKR